MTVVVACNLSEGVVLGTDSAISVPTDAGVKVYENAEKLFQFADKPIGIAIYGLGYFGNRSIGSFLREFEILNSHSISKKPTKIDSLVEALRDFFLTKYKEFIIPPLELAKNKKFEEIPQNELPILGMIVSGFSDGAYLSEIWEIIVPLHKEPRSSKLVNQQGAFGVSWYATYEPIFRYIKGIGNIYFNHLLEYLKKFRPDQAISDIEIQELTAIINKSEYQFPVQVMPMKECVDYVRFLVELVINHHRFSTGHPIVGGRVNIGKVSYREKCFQIVKSD